MAKIHTLGFPRIGKHRELKRALEAYWNQKIDKPAFTQQIEALEAQRFESFSHLDLVQVGDFSLYDHVLDTSFLFSNVPQRALQSRDSLDNYFRVARGKASINDCCAASASQMTKWFDTNYHYIVPEFNQDTVFSLNSDALLGKVRHARSQGFEVKPVIIGPLTYLYLGEVSDNTPVLDLLDKLLNEYKLLLNQLAKLGVSWVQIDEPALVTELSPQWQFAYKYAYEVLKHAQVKLLLTTYFGDLGDNYKLVCELPVAGIHVDLTRAQIDASALADRLLPEQVLSLGVIDGRNVWVSDLSELIEKLQALAQKKGDLLWLAPSCSLLHTPVDINTETNLPAQVKPWLAFAQQKLEELHTLKVALGPNPGAASAALLANKKAIEYKKRSALRSRPEVQASINAIEPSWYVRDKSFTQRYAQQADLINLPQFPTTTIGSFPQTPEIRKLRQQYKARAITLNEYEKGLEQHIAQCIAQQEEIGLDVLVHGEAERNDMVEYFASYLNGMLTTDFAWVQSYGSRCVKPPIIYGDISRKTSMTVKWIRFAQGLTAKPVKGMLTGPVTILNWSFVRDDQPRALTAKQIALAVREEVLELEANGTQIIQIDEAALREGLPLKRAQWTEYLSWAIDAFKLSAGGVKNETQIHTHMCYSQFNDILPDIQRMDADVITIETARSQMKLLDAFNDFKYANSIGPGVYDIHSPNIPSVKDIESLMKRAMDQLPSERLWVNPDCGLKTRAWPEVKSALENLVEAALALRQNQVSV
ncbi:5-methyltetrahydropteroyltriglutamate--homocysteine S-methyltransferase [Glaciecola siphonariae]|uniref:5-methyltetrahydropteroyltriglutamate--homocysteine methyltransferase n=1 Tax=Glaciecola siphonariae TaxID=521012 RepID=A0ABV9LZF7_9ALTE